MRSFAPALLIALTAALSCIAFGVFARPYSMHRAVHFVAVRGSDSGPGTADRPWATLNHAAAHARAGDTIIVRGGLYVLSMQIRPRRSGRSDARITFIAYPGEKPILDARKIPYGALHQGNLDNGVFQIEDVSYIRVADLTIINSHEAGFTIRDASNIDLINNSTRDTFSSGIAVWDTDHKGEKTRHIRILGNSIRRATIWGLAPPGVPMGREEPQEALSVAGAVNFVVAYNHVYDGDKEGIDIKETSKNGKVHHNFVNNMGRQGLYLDSWFGELSHIEVFSNVLEDCRGAGIALSVENGRSLHDVDIYNNLVFANSGTGLLFSRWGVDNPRWNVRIKNNIFYHNGYGPPGAGQDYYWITGGLYLYSTNLHDISIIANIFSENRGFQIGYSKTFLKQSESWETVARKKNIGISGNLIDGRNLLDEPIQTGGDPPDGIEIYAVNGIKAIFGNPLFKDPSSQNFDLRHGSPAMSSHFAVGASSARSTGNFWWKRNFPPTIAGLRN
jgi:hypothetical protein